MIRIAFVIDTIESPTAGTEKQLLLLIKHLDRNQFKPYLCVLRNSRWIMEKFSDCEIFSANIPSFKSAVGWRGLWNLKKYLQAKKIDLVQVFFRDASIAGILAARLSGIKTIIGSRRNQGYWLNRKELLIQKFFSKFLTIIVANSRSTKSWAVKTENIPADRVKVIHNGIELEPYLNINQRLKEEVRKELNISSGSNVVGIVANLRPIKAIDDFLKAAAIVHAKMKNVQFLILGEGCEYEKLKTIVADLNMGGSVSFLGRKNDIPRILSAFDVGVLSSRSESASNAIIEYLAAGLPVVCTDVGEASEVIVEGTCGHIVPPNDVKLLSARILQVLQNRQSYNLRNAKQLIKSMYDINQTKHIYETLYLNVARI